MAEAKKVQPREKDVQLQEGTFRVTGNPHFINGQIAPVGTIVQLPEGVEPGEKLVGENDVGKAAVEKAKRAREARKKGDAGKAATISTGNAQALSDAEARATAAEANAAEAEKHAADAEAKSAALEAASKKPDESAKPTK